MKMLVISDTHCGHGLGLTPPEFDAMPLDETSEMAKLYHGRRYLWDWFVGAIDQLRPDIMEYNGDAIDGKGERQGGIEQLTTDRNQQVDMAECIVDYIGAAENIVISGTPYHTGADEQYERMLAERIGAEFHDALYKTIGGVNFFFRHFVAGSVAPYGNATPLMRAGTNARAWHDEYPETYPRPDVLVRSHAHRFAAVDDGSMLTMCTPSLQGFGSIFGSMRDRPPVHFGFVTFSMKHGAYSWNRHLLKYPKFPPPEGEQPRTFAQKISGWLKPRN